MSQESMIGIKTSQKTNDARIQYYSVDAIEDMLNNKTHKTMYECYGKLDIGSDQYVKVFFDVDKKPKDDPNLSIDDFEKIHNDAISFITNNFNCSIDDLVISEAHSYDKNKIQFSEHIVIKNQKAKMITLHQWMKDNKSELDRLNIDKIVYSEGGRTFRMVTTTKENENRPLIIKNGNLRDHFITYVNDIDKIFTYTPLTKEESKIKKSLNVIVNESIEASNDDIVKLLNLLDTKKYSNYAEWIKIMLICKASGGLFEDFNNWSKKIDNYSGFDDTYDKWLKAKPNGTLKIGTLHYYAKTDNKEGYFKLFGQDDKILDFIRSINDITEIYDQTLSQLFNLIVNNNEKRVITTGKDEWYLFDGKWHQGNHILTKIIESYILPILKSKKQFINFENDDDKDTYIKLKKFIEFFCTSSKIKSMCAFLFSKLFDEKLKDKFDSNPYLLNCKNGVYDFKAKCLRKQVWNDYVLKCTNVNYIDKIVENKLIEIITNLFQSIIPDESEREYICNILAESLIGINKREKFYLWEGSGRNGKSLLINFTKSIMGDYAIVAHNSIFDANQSMDKEYTNDIKGARLVIGQEIEKGSKLRCSYIKGLTGNDAQTTRALFQGSTTWKPVCKIFMLSNGGLNIDSSDDAIWMRIEITKFKVSFKENPNPNTEYEQKINTSLKETLENDTIKELYLRLLISQANEILDNQAKEILDKKFKFKVPQSILDNNNNVRSTSDNYTQWFNEMYYIDHKQIENETDEVHTSRQLNTLWNKYKRSSYFDKKKDTLQDLKKAIISTGLECTDRFILHILIDKEKKKKEYRSYFKGIMENIDSQIIE